MTNCNLFVEIIAELKRLSEENKEMKNQMIVLMNENLLLKEKSIITEDDLSKKFFEFLQSNDIPTQDIVQDMIRSEIEDFDLANHSDIRSLDDKIDEIDGRVDDLRNDIDRIDSDEIAESVIKEIKSRL